MVNGYYGIEPFTGRNIKNCLFSSFECLLSKATDSSDSQRDYTKCQYSRKSGKKVVLYLFAKEHNGHNDYEFILLEVGSPFLLKHITSYKE